MDVDPRVEDLTGSEVDDEETSGGEVVSSPSGSSSSGSGSSGSSLYDDGSTTFLLVIIHDVDGDPDENSEPIPVWGPPVLAMLLGPSVMTTLIPIEEDMDVLNDLLICHCPEGRGREGVGSLVVQLPRIGVISDLKVENKGEDLGRGGEDGEG